jgi:hypothetical protein
MISPAQKDQQGPGNKIGALQQIPVKKRALVSSDRVDGKQVETQPGDRRLDPDFARMKPVLQLAAIEHQLQGANPQAQRQEPEEIERFATQVAGLADKDQNAQRTDHADRQVDVKDPAPAVVIGQPAAERRPHNWPEDCPDTKNRHCVPVALRRIDLKQGSLR